MPFFFCSAVKNAEIFYKYFNFFEILLLFVVLLLYIGVYCYFVLIYLNKNPVIF